MPVIRKNVYTDITIEEVMFQEYGERKLNMQIFKPEGWNSQDRRPAIIFYFGGGFYKGNTDHFRMQAEYFAHIGMVCITPEYRLTNEQGVGVIDCMKDAKAALRYVYHHCAELGIDEKRIVVAGGSAGGAQACSTVLVNTLDEEHESSIPCAMVLFNPGISFGSSDIQSLPKGTLININGNLEKVEDLANATDSMNDPELAEYSPVDFIRAQLPPTLIISGEADVAISCDSLRAFQKKYQSYGNHCELVSYPKRNHGFFNWNSSEEHVCYYDTLHVMEGFLRNQQILNPGLRTQY